jgi:uncharacterized membrane protein YfcA
VSRTILAAVLVGFVAQMIDGALGMAYGVTSTTILLSMSVPPAAASASVHTAEMVTTAVSGLFHWRFGNVDRRLVLPLILPGILGGVAGAYLLTAVPGNAIKPVVAVYLAAMGGLILYRAFRGSPRATPKGNTAALGLVGGFLDAVGGGGWGPIVTSTLVARGHDPRFSIGSVNLAEFFVTTAQAITFFVTIGSVLQENWQVIAGLLVGGTLAAPLAACVTRRLPARTLMILVGILIVLLSLRTIVLALFLV